MSQPENNTVVMTQADFNKLVALIPEGVKQAHPEHSVPNIHVVEATLTEVADALDIEVN